MKRNTLFQRFSLIIILCGFAAPAFAAGFFFPFESGAGLGEFYAGGAAIAEDASTAYYNPAGLVRLNQSQMVYSGVMVDASAIFSGTGTPALAAPGYPKTGNTQGGDNGIIPAFHVAIPLSPKMSMGFSIVAPYGFDDDFQPNSPVRYIATKSSFFNIDLTPSMAYRITDRFSAGVGLDVVRGGIDLENFASFGTGTDAFVSAKAYCWGFGYHGGVLFQYSPATRFGLAYFSRIPERFHGVGQIVNGPGGITVISTNFQEPIRTPSMTQLSAYHDINERWSGMGSVTYAQWNHFKTADVLNAPALLPPSFTTPAIVNVSTNDLWHNTWEGAVGVHYKINQRWFVRAGFDSMQTPTQDATREIRFADANKNVYAVGVHFQTTKATGLDASYARVTEKHANINFTDAGGNNINGVSDTNCDLYGLQLTWNMG